MQIRKRAKSVSFGQKTEEEKEEEEKAKLKEKEAILEKVDELLKDGGKELEETPLDEGNVEETAPPKEEEPSENIPAPEERQVEVEFTQKEETETLKEDSGISPVGEKILINETKEIVVEAKLTPDKTDEEAKTASSVTMSATDTFFVEKEVKKNYFGYFLIIAMTAFLVGLVGMVALSFLLPKFSGGINLPLLIGKSPTSTPIPTPKIAVKNTPSIAQINLSDYNVKILNGSGITGAATRLKTALSQAGFSITSSGNADQNGYAQTEISAKKSVPSGFISKLKNELIKTYSVSDSVSPLDSSVNDDVIVIIGSNLK